MPIASIQDALHAYRYSGQALQQLAPVSLALAVVPDAASEPRCDSTRRRCHGTREVAHEVPHRLKGEGNLNERALLQSRSALLELCVLFAGSKRSVTVCGPRSPGMGTRLDAFACEFLQAPQPAACNPWCQACRKRAYAWLRAKQAVCKRMQLHTPLVDGTGHRRWRWTPQEQQPQAQWRSPEAKITVAAVAAHALSHGSGVTCFGKSRQ
jgi:hypothetical protein